MQSKLATWSSTDWLLLEQKKNLTHCPEIADHYNLGKRRSPYIESEGEVSPFISSTTALEKSGHPPLNIPRFLSGGL
jgi:hypothetical protein